MATTLPHTLTHSQKITSLLHEELLPRIVEAYAMPAFWAYARDLMESESSDKQEHGKFLLSVCKNYFNQCLQFGEWEINGLKSKNSLIAKHCFLFADLSGGEIRLWHLDLQNADFRYSNLAGAKFTNSAVNNADFSHANLAGAEYTDNQILSVNSLYNTKLGDRLSTYNTFMNKNHAGREALENKVRASYEAKEFNPLYLKIIQISGFSPLKWGNEPEKFNEMYLSLVKNENSLIANLTNCIQTISDPNNLQGYEKTREGDRLKFFLPKHENRAAQMAKLNKLTANVDSNNDDSDDDKPDKLTQIVDQLFSIHNQIIRENNWQPSTLFSQISEMCKQLCPKPDTDIDAEKTNKLEN